MMLHAIANRENITIELIKNMLDCPLKPNMASRADNYRSN